MNKRPDRYTITREEGITSIQKIIILKKWN